MTDDPIKTKGKPDDTDRLVGQRIREKRIARGWSQEFLAHKLNLSFQQVQKYENGTNRVSSGTLYQLALIFNCETDSFFTWPAGRKQQTLEFIFESDAQGNIIMALPNLAGIMSGAAPRASYRVTFENIGGKDAK